MIENFIPPAPFPLEDEAATHPAIKAQKNNTYQRAICLSRNKKFRAEGTNNCISLPERRTKPIEQCFVRGLDLWTKISMKQPYLTSVVGKLVGLNLVPD